MVLNSSEKIAGFGNKKRTVHPVQWTTIPVLVKIYKLLINELSNQIETNMCKAGKEDDDEEEEDWEDEDVDGEEDIQLRGQTLSDLIDSMAAEFNGYDVDKEEEEDPDFLKDPTYQIDLQAYLTEFLQSLSQQTCYTTFSSHHNESEKHVLLTININV